MTRASRPPAAVTSSILAGIDLGHERTRIVCLDLTNDRGIISWADEPTPAGLFFSGRLHRVVEAGAWIRKLLAAMGAAPECLVLPLPQGDAQVRRVAVPAVDERESVLRALRAHAQFRGTDALGWRFDYRVVDANAGQVLAVAGTSEGVGLAQALARSAAAGPSLVVSAAEVALVNAWSATGSAERRLLLEGGHGAVTLALVEDGRPLAFRRVLLAGRDLQREPGGGDVTRAAAAEWASRIAHEMRLLVGAVVRDGGAAPPVSIAGGLAASRTLRDALEQARSAPVAPLDVFSYLGCVAPRPSAEGGAALAVAYGLAAGGSGPRDSDAFHVNLHAEGAVSTAAAVHESPRVVGAALLRDGKVRRCAVAAAVLALGVAGADLALGRRVRLADADLVRARSDSTALAADLARVRELEAERARLGGGAAAILALDRARDAWPRFMDRVAATLPPHVWLAGRQEMVNLDPGTGAFEFVLRGFAGSAEQVGRFERDLSGGSVAAAAVRSTARVDLAGLAAIRWEMHGRVALPPDPLSLVTLEEGAGYRGPGGDGAPATRTPGED